jgi:hypothetical protein
MLNASLFAMIAKIVCTVGFSMFLAAMVTEELPPPHAAQDNEWKSEMRRLASLLHEMIPYFVDAERFNAPENKATIETQCAALAGLAHGFAFAGEAPHRLESMDPDPSIPMVASMFAQDSDNACSALKLGKREDARVALNGIIHYCVICHTRSIDDPALEGSMPFVATATLPSLQTSNWFLAQRRYREATGQMDIILLDRDFVRTKPDEWSQSARQALAVAVKVYGDPHGALRVADLVLLAEDAPRSVRRDALSWREDILSWLSENAAAAKKSGLLGAAKTLIRHARALRYSAPARNVDVYYLRTASLVHSYLRTGPSGTDLSVALELLGECYGVLADDGLWDLHEAYYQACIVNAPHSSIGRACYLHFEESVFLRYVSRSKTCVKPEITEQMQSLEALSSPFENFLSRGRYRFR